MRRRNRCSFSSRSSLLNVDYLWRFFHKYCYMHIPTTLELYHFYFWRLMCILMVVSSAFPVLTVI